MSIIDAIKNVVTSVGGTAYNGTDSQNNIKADSVTFPCVFIDQPITAKGKVRQSSVLDKTYTVKIFFADKGNIDNTPTQDQTIIDAQTAICDAFLLAIQSYEVNSQRIFNMSGGEDFTQYEVLNLPFDVGCTGVILEMDFKLYNYNPLC